MAGSETKFCRPCNQTKPLEAFNRHGGKADGRQGQCRECHKRLKDSWDYRNRGNAAERQRRWRQRNPNAARAQAAKRQARLASAAGGPYDARREDFLARWVYYGGLCVWCSKPADTLDHSLPVSRYPHVGNFPANIVPACRGCNSQKKNKTPKEYREYLRRIAESFPPCT